MFDLSFILKIVLSFIVAAVWITLSTVVAEKRGTKIGGILAGIPSNGVVSLFFIALINSPSFSSEVAKSAITAMSIPVIFIFVFVLAARKYRYLSFAIAIFVWLVFALLLGFTGYNDFVIGAMAYVILSLALFHLLESRFHIQSVRGNSDIWHSRNDLAFRALFAGSTVSAIVFLSSAFGPFWGGIISVFPAATISNMFLLSRAQGFEFARATGKTMIISSGSVMVYAIFVVFTYPALGLWLGTALSFAAALLFSFLVYTVMEKVK